MEKVGFAILLDVANEIKHTRVYNYYRRGCSVKNTKQLFAGLILMALGLGTAQADYTLNLMKGVTKVSHDVYDLHMLILWICVLIGVGVFGTMFYSIYHHRKSKGHTAAQFHENTTVEIIWTIIPTLILVGMAIPATKTLMELDDVQDSEMSIKVTGWQWKWEYDYLDNGIHFFSSLDEASNKARQVGSGIDPRSVPHYLLNVDKPLVIPTKKKIRFVFTAADVLHSWWVPDLGWKKDAIPGFINESWTSVDKPGTYRGQCTELCGKDHGFMPIVVIAMDQPEYDAWVKKTKDEAQKGADLSDQGHDELISKGAGVYAKNCSTCHLPDGKGVPGAFPAITESAVVKGDINAQTMLVLNGKGGMPAFGKMLKADELAQVITYTRNALGNAVGDEIQPKAIQELLPNKSAAPVSKPEAKAATPEKIEPIADMATEALVALGKTVYEGNCASCHQSEGQGMAPMFPALTGSAVVKGDMNAQVNLMLNGKGMMPAFGHTLDAKEFAAVVTFTRNSLGNSVKDAIQPSAIQKLQAALPPAQDDE
ncbi:MAG: cytochrome c oxidase subunit II [Methylovulum miyakonense]|uniref:cytochrome c oxidase subunit II n=1 Tax=Methylovulum miyakonense TaxID=645578 RepID=UPI003BB731A4